MSSRTSIELLPPRTSKLAFEQPAPVHLAAESDAVTGSIHENELYQTRSNVSAANVTKGKTTVIIASITMVTGVASMLNGLVTVILPTLQKDLDLSQGALLWPVAITALTCGCTLLLSGSIADAIGSKIMYLIGTFTQAAFVLGCGLAKNGTEMILFRGLAGVSLSFCLPSAVSIITATFTGKQRNLAFAFMGGGQPFGFSLGLVLGGVLTEYVSWRAGFYIGAGIIGLNILLIFWALPSASEETVLTWAQRKQRILTEIDWVGAGLASTSLAMFSYVFATLTGNTHNIREASSIALLSIAGALVPAFIFWVGRQEKLGMPAIIPNSLWRNQAFTTVCLTVFLNWGAFNALETILTFYFQNVQDLSPLQTSIRFLPAAAAGLIAYMIVGSLIHRVPANILCNVGFIISCGAPLAMAFAKPDSNYWSSGFIGNILNPIGTDCSFTVANLLISSVFPPKTQGLAGGVFNTISQIGKSVGVALVAVIASSVTANSSYTDKTSPDALLDGYRATFWFCFALCLTVFLLSLVGLRRIGNIGHKRD